MFADGIQMMMVAPSNVFILSTTCGKPALNNYALFF
jgi:hypothetical protein